MRMTLHIDVCEMKSIMYYSTEQSRRDFNQPAIFVKTAPMLLEQTGRVLLTWVCSVCCEKRLQRNPRPHTPPPRVGAMSWSLSLILRGHTGWAGAPRETATLGALRRSLKKWASAQIGCLWRSKLWTWQECAGVLGGGWGFECDYT